MTDKEVRHLSRSQLIVLLAEVSGENETLRAETERMRAEIEALRITNEKLEALGELSRQILASVSTPDAPPARQETPAEPDGGAVSAGDAPPAPAAEPEPAKEGEAARKPDAKLSFLRQRARSAFGDRK